MQQIASSRLYTKDKVTLAYEHAQHGHRSIIIVCPGFFNSKKNRWMRKSRELLSREHDTMIFDFRGHGESGGKFSWSAKEHRDVEAILDYLKPYNYRSTGILAYSLGAAASINAVARRKSVQSMILVSCPYSFWKINYHFWEPEMLSDLKDNFECDWEGKGARAGSLLNPKRKPINEIKKIKDIPVFFIHGKRDWIIKDYHSQRLYEAAQGVKKIELIEDGLHAERLIQQHPEKMKTLILDWFKSTLKKEV
ncbi:alpha/beta hydrolase [Candidatus Omnitrophota bacterium]